MPSARKRGARTAESSAPAPAATQAPTAAAATPPPPPPPPPPPSPPPAATAASTAAATTAEAPGGHVCSECDQQRADVFCLVCRAFFCAACDTAVHRAELARHRRVSVAPYRFTRTDARPPAFHCLRHVEVTDDSLSYCTTCHALCCQDCAAGGQHAGHRVIACTDARCVGAVAGAVRERLALLAGAVERTGTRRKDIADIRSELDRAMVETLYQIDERFKRLRALASEREAALTEEVIATTSRLMAKLSLQERACSLALDDARYAMLTAERFVPCPSVTFDERGNASLVPPKEEEEEEDEEQKQKKQQQQGKGQEGENEQETTTETKEQGQEQETTKKQQQEEEGEKPEKTAEEQEQEEEDLPNTAEAIGTLVDTLHLLGDADGSLRDVEGVRPGITTPHVRLSGTEAYEQLCGAVRGLCGVRVEMPPVRLAVSPAGGVWWNALMLEWRVDSSCAAFMRLHGDAQYELQMRAPGEADFRTLYRGPATEHTVRELLPQTTYDFRCRVQLATGEAAPFCAPVAVTTSTPPGGFQLRDGPNYMLDTSRMIVTKTSTAKECWDATVVAAAPLAPHTVHRWFVRLRALHAPTASILVGVAPATIDQTQIGNGNKCGWYLFSGISSLWSGPPQRMRNRILFGVTPLRAGDAVGVILDTTGARGVLSFFITGHDWRVGYDDIPLDTPLVPCVILSEPNDCVEVVVF